MITDDKRELASRSNRPESSGGASQLRRRGLSFLPYNAFVKFVSAHVLSSSPFYRGNMSESGPDQHHSRVSIRETAYNPGSAANLFHDAFEAVIYPILIRKVNIKQRLLHAGFYKTSNPFLLHGS